MDYRSKTAIQVRVWIYRENPARGLFAARRIRFNFWPLKQKPQPVCSLLLLFHEHYTPRQCLRCPRRIIIYIKCTMELVGCAACEWLAGGGGEDVYISSIYIYYKYTHTRIHTLYIYICVCVVCDTDTKGPKGELRPTFVQPRFLPQGHRIYTCV